MGTKTGKKLQFSSIENLQIFCQLSNKTHFFIPIYLKLTNKQSQQ